MGRRPIGQKLPAQTLFLTSQEKSELFWLRQRKLRNRGPLRTADKLSRGLKKLNYFADNWDVYFEQKVLRS